MLSAETVRKELFMFDAYHKKYASLELLRSLYNKTAESPHLVHAKV